MRSSIPNPLGGGLVLARTANELIEAQEGATYRGRGHKTTRGVLPRLSARSVAASAQAPYQRVGVWGVAANMTGSYSSTTPFLWLNISTNTAEWKAAGHDPAYSTPFPPDMVILDGRLGGPAEYWVLR